LPVTEKLGWITNFLANLKGLTMCLYL